MIVNYGAHGGGSTVQMPGTPLLWFDGQDIDRANNTTFADGDLVGTADKVFKNKGSTGSAGDTLATGGLAFKKVATGLNGSSIVFGGTAFLRSGTIPNTTQPITYLLVFKPMRLSPTQVFIDGNNDTNRNGIFLDPSLGFIEAYCGSVNRADWAIPTLNAWNFLILKMDGANTIVQMNNWPPAVMEKPLTVGTGSIDGLQIGGGRSGGGNCTMEFAEMAAWKNDPPSFEDIATYVNAKYSRASFPASNGYDGGTPKFNVQGGNRIAMYGDSFSANTGNLGRWWAQAGGFKDQVDAAVATPITYLQLGVDGRTAANLDTNVNAEVVALNPQPNAVIITDTYNDWIGWNFNNAPTLAGFLASIRSVLTKLKAGIPGVQIAWFTILSPGTELSPNPNYLSQSAINNCIAQACREQGATVIDITSAKELYEAIHNGPPNSVAPAALTPDNIHPTALAKVIILGNCAIARMNLVA